jgi:translation initiation factor IF-2
MEELRLQEKVRVYALARELNIESKDLLDMCKKAGFDVKNQLSSLEPEQRDAVVEMIKKGSHKQPAAPPKPVPTPVLNVGSKVPTLQTPRPKPKEPEPPRPAPAPAVTTPAPAPPTPVAPAPVEVPAAAKTVEVIQPRAVPTIPSSPVPPVVAAPQVVEAKPVLAPAASATPAPPTTPPAPPEKVPPTVPVRVPQPPITQPRDVPDIGSGNKPSSSPRKRPMPTVFGHSRIATPPPQRIMAPKPVKEEPRQKPIQVIDPILFKESQKDNRVLQPKDLLPVAPVAAPAEEEEDDGKGGKKANKGVPGRDRRRVARQERAEKRKKVEVVDGKIIVDDDDEPVHRPSRNPKRKIVHQQPTMPRIGKVPLETPITVRSLSEAVGVRSVEILFKLKDHGATATNINSSVEPDMAEIIALEYGCELEIKHALDTEENILEEYGFNEPDKPENLIYRAPVVTIMGHVDHGKTSLLDKIRKSNVAATEAGGITQVIRAWRVEHGGRPITFLDTPGHEAFTKMRARGANVTDIAVIVVAADDGVMPQTEEAIQHARAAKVSLVVAINKVDMPQANVNKTRQQLYGLNVLPDNMGGDTPFVETSAATGKGIDELLDQLSVVAELKELKADPKKHARGTCLEANLSEGEGVQATLLVREGTLRKGDVILCGPAFGRIRQMYNDLGQPLEEAGPSVPVRITGLDEMPNADDPFYVLPDLGVARDLASKRKFKLVEAAQHKRVPLTLERLSQAKIAELKVILKADFRGSIEAIRKELEKLYHDEVRVRILKDGIGTITEADVWLALTSPEDTMIVGFNAVPDDRARALADEKGVQIREYAIIYNLTNDIRAALEGKLKPREEVVNLGRAVVRKAFKISRVGTVAGCFVTQGVIRRNAKVRLIREGVVIFPPNDRTVGLDSLKRVKDDASEVREGFECGIKIMGYDDIKTGDVIEAYRVEQVQRTLDDSGG